MIFTDICVVVSCYICLPVSCFVFCCVVANTCSICLFILILHIAFNRCAGCQQVFYCDAKCQTKDWPRHKSGCKSIKKLAGDNKTGWSKKILTKGETGTGPKAGQEVFVHYTGWVSIHTTLLLLLLLLLLLFYTFSQHIT
jgi:MYND finger